MGRENVLLALMHFLQSPPDSDSAYSAMQVDWDKWVDEDEEETKPEFDMSSLGNLQDFSKYGADGGEDSDDEEIPPLEEDMDESKPAA